MAVISMKPNAVIRIYSFNIENLFVLANLIILLEFLAYIRIVEIRPKQKELENL